jgi:hypothetical protein
MPELAADAVRQAAMTLLSAAPVSAVIATMRTLLDTWDPDRPQEAAPPSSPAAIPLKPVAAPVTPAAPRDKPDAVPTPPTAAPSRPNGTPRPNGGARPLDEGQVRYDNA